MRPPADGGGQMKILTVLRHRQKGEGMSPLGGKQMLWRPAQNLQPSDRIPANAEKARNLSPTEPLQLHY